MAPRQTTRNKRSEQVTLLKGALDALTITGQPDVEKAAGLIREALDILRARRATSGDKTPSAYNLFVRKCMAEIKVEQPDMDSISRMRRCAELWRASKVAPPQ